MQYEYNVYKKAICILYIVILSYGYLSQIKNTHLLEQVGANVPKKK